MVLNGERDIFGEPVSHRHHLYGSMWSGRMWSVGTGTGAHVVGDGWSANTWSSAGWN